MNGQHCAHRQHTANDRYWGDGGDGSGRNQLGLTLMRVRDELGPNPEFEAQRSRTHPEHARGRVEGRRDEGMTKEAVKEGGLSQTLVVRAHVAVVLAICAWFAWCSCDGVGVSGIPS